MKTLIEFSLSAYIERAVEIVAALLFFGLMYFVATAS
jgi:hypothetical protein